MRRWYVFDAGPVVTPRPSASVAPASVHQYLARMLARDFLMLALVVALCGCDKSSPSSSSSGGGKQSGKPAAKPGPDFSAWDLEGKKKAWQGSWVLKDNGSFQAWTITGAKVQVWDGAEDKTYELQIQAPCRAYFADGNMRFPHEFAVVAGKLRSRPGGAGYRKGREVLFCDPAGDVYTLDGDDNCTLWKHEFEDFKKTDGECGLKKDADGNETFFHKGSNEGVFKIVGDAIVSDVSADTEPAADHAAAKERAKAKAVAK
jgi:hypothetical protein